MARSLPNGSRNGADPATASRRWSKPSRRRTQRQRPRTQNPKAALCCRGDREGLALSPNRDRNVARCPLGDRTMSAQTQQKKSVPTAAKLCRPLRNSEKKMRVSKNSCLLWLSSSCHAHRWRESLGVTRGHPSYAGCTTREGDAAMANRVRFAPKRAADEAKHCRSGAGSAIWQSRRSPSLRTTGRRRARHSCSARLRDCCR